MNAGIFFSTQILSRLLGFAYFLFLARTLGPSEFGALSFALALLVVVDTFSDLGLSPLLVRDVSQAPSLANRYVANLLSLRLLVSLAGYATCVGGAALAGYPPVFVQCVAIVGVGLAFTGAGAILESTLQAHHSFGVTSAAHVALGVVQAGLGAAVLMTGGSVAQIAATFVAGNAAYAGILLTGVLRLGVPVRLGSEVAFMRRTLRTALPFAGIGILFVLSMRVEFLVLSWVAPPETLGIYGAVAKFNEAAMLAPITLMAVLRPAFSRDHVTDPAHLRASFANVLRFGLLVAVPGTAVAILLSENVIGLLLPNYPGAPRLTAILFLSFPAFSVYCVTLALLTVTGRQDVSFRLVVALAALQVAMAIGLISAYGSEGAALSFVAWSMVAAVAALAIPRSDSTRTVPVLRCATPALAGAATMTAALGIAGSLATAPQVAVALAAYGLGAAPAWWLTRRA